MAHFGEMYVPGIYLEGPIPLPDSEAVVYKIAGKLKEQPTEFEPGSVIPKIYTWAMTMRQDDVERLEEVIQASLRELIGSAEKIGGFDETWNGEWKTK
jgi:hypothetical protein